MTAKEKELAIKHIRMIEDEVDEFLSDKFMELEIGLNELGLIDDNLVINTTFNNTTDKLDSILFGLRKLQKLIKRIEVE